MTTPTPLVVSKITCPYCAEVMIKVGEVVLGRQDALDLAVLIVRIADGKLIKSSTSDATGFRVEWNPNSEFLRKYYDRPAE